MVPSLPVANASLCKVKNRPRHNGTCCGVVGFERAVQEAAPSAAELMQAPAEEEIVCAVTAQRLATLRAVGHILSVHCMEAACAKSCCRACMQYWLGLVGLLWRGEASVQVVGSCGRFF